MTSGIASAAAVLLDIEGTTTSIEFVHRVLFPYAAAAVEGFLLAHKDEPEVQAACSAVLKDATAQELSLGDAAAALAVVRRQMAADVKATGLKQLQGLIWRRGYESGALVGEVYDDVPRCLRSWHASGRKVAIYSSGSRLAQELLFRHSTAGDLTPCLSGYYDTTSGPKREPASYVAIARDWGREPASVVFLSDVPAECEAAAAAGMGAVLILRPGNPPLPAHLPFPVHADLTHV